MVLSFRTDSFEMMTTSEIEKIVSVKISIINEEVPIPNRAHRELNYNNHISKGQELQDLKKALDA